MRSSLGLATDTFALTPLRPFVLLPPNLPHPPTCPSPQPITPQVHSPQPSSIGPRDHPNLAFPSRRTIVQPAPLQIPLAARPLPPKSLPPPPPLPTHPSAPPPGVDPVSPRTQRAARRIRPRRKVQEMPPRTRSVSSRKRARRAGGEPSIRSGSSSMLLSVSTLATWTLRMRTSSSTHTTADDSLYPTRTARARPRAASWARSILPRASPRPP